DHWGERLTGCPTCNRWQTATGEWCRTTSWSFQIGRGDEGVKPEYVLAAVVTACLTVMSVTPALAAPRQIEEFCFEQARRYVTGDPYRRGAWEAAIANCIADLTPAPTEKRRYRDYRKY